MLTGWPKLKNDLRRPSMEEVSYRTDVFSLDGITGSQREEYIHWLRATCTNGQTAPGSIVATEVIDLLASRLGTPLQIEWHPTQDRRSKPATKLLNRPSASRWPRRCYPSRWTIPKRC